MLLKHNWYQNGCVLKAVLICWSAVFLKSVKLEQRTWECVWFHAGFDISLASLELSWTGGENAEDLLDLCWEILLRLPVYVIREQFNLWCITFAVWTAMLFTNTFTDTFHFDSACGSEFVISFTNYTDISFGILGQAEWLCPLLLNFSFTNMWQHAKEALLGVFMFDRLADV